MASGTPGGCIHRAIYQPAGADLASTDSVSTDSASTDLISTYWVSPYEVMRRSFLRG